MSYISVIYREFFVTFAVLFGVILAFSMLESCSNDENLDESGVIYPAIRVENSDLMLRIRMKEVLYG